MLTVITYIYPQAIKYIEAFVESVSRQTNKEFNLLVFNDGVADAGLLFDCYTEPVKIINVAGSVSKIRFDSFEFLRNYESDFFLFQDIDDTMSNNRVEVCINHLNKYDLVCNDLTIIDSEGQVKMYSIWKDRLREGFEFDSQFLIDKNILGFTNTALSRNLLNRNLKRCDHITAVDWFIFFQLLFENGCKAVFTSQCQSNYRQHDQNIAGIGNVDSARMLYVIKVKKEHYKALEYAGINVSDYLSEIKQLERKATTFSINNFHRTTGLFWWEETKYLYEEN